MSAYFQVWCKKWYGDTGSRVKQIGTLFEEKMADSKEAELAADGQKKQGCRVALPR